MKLPKELTTVTPASKFLAIILFVSLPVVGFLLGMRHQQIISSPSIITNYPTPTPIAAPTIDPSVTANWKTYINNELGFIVNYPANAIIQEVAYPPEAIAAGFYKNTIGKETQILYDPVSNCDYCGFTIYISATSTPSNLDLKDSVYQGYSALGGYENYKANFRDYKIGGQDGLYIILPESVSTRSQDVFVMKNNKLFSFRVIGNVQSDYKNMIAFFDQILSTFKFTDQLDNKNLKNICEEKEGNWLDTYKECEAIPSGKGFDQSSCTTLGGKFNECDSACRHNPQAEACIAVCVRVCKF